ncbi:MAG: gamma carbonic anhydrase family protein [Oligoflexia bacterium]
MAILPHHGRTPLISADVFIAPSADVIGEVTIGAQSSVWFQVVIRGDVHTIQIGERTNIQDHSCLHVTRKRSPLKVGSDCTIGHRVTLHGCTIQDRVLVGMGAIIMDDAVIEDDCIIAAGALVTQNTRIPAGSLAMGSPARVVRPLKKEELEFLRASAQNYVNDAAQYSAQLTQPIAP